MKRLLALAITLAVLAAAGLPSFGQADDGPRIQRTATIGFYVNNIRDIDVTRQRFIADFYMWMRYPGPKDNPERSDDDIERIEFVNGHIESVEVQEQTKLDSGENYICWRYSVTFTSRFDLRHFPMDRQRLEMILENPALEADQLSYAHDDKSYHRSPAPKDRWGIRNGLTINEFRIVGTERPLPEIYKYETDFGHSEMAVVGSHYARLSLVIKIERLSGPYFVKIALPFLLILATAYMAFWVPPQEIVGSVLLAMLSLISAIAFQLSISQHRPETGYLVLVDKFFISTAVFIVAILLESIASYNLEKTGETDAAYRLDVAARVIFPIAFVAVGGFLIWTAARAG